MAAAAKGKPEVLLLEGARPAWRVGGGEAQQLVDALPYFDKEYEDAAVRAEVNRLVQEEMRRSRKRPADFLKELPPVPPLRPEMCLLEPPLTRATSQAPPLKRGMTLRSGHEKCPMFFREFERVRAGKPPVSGIDQSRYEPKQPTGGRAVDPSAWKNVVQTACCHLQHLDGKRLNLELMQQYGSNAWRMHNQHLEAFLARLQKQVAELKSKIELVNRDRKLNQQAAANELSRLNAEWQAGVRKNIEIEAACDALQEEVAVLTAKATELGIDLKATPAAQ